MVLPTLDEKRAVVPPLESDPLLPHRRDGGRGDEPEGGADAAGAAALAASSSASNGGGSLDNPTRYGDERQNRHGNNKEDTMKGDPKDGGDRSESTEKDDDDENPPRSRLSSWAGSVQEGAASLAEALVSGEGTFAQIVMDSAEQFQHNLMEQVTEVADALMHELQQVDDDGMFFLEMGLARNLSILPTDVVDVAAAAASTNHVVVVAAVEAAIVTVEAEQGEIEDKADLTGDDFDEAGEGSALFATDEEEQMLLPHPPQIAEDLEQSVEFLAGITRQFSLRRSSSILSTTTATPSVKPPLSVAGEDVGVDVEEITVPVVPPPHPINAYLLLATAVVALSSIGPFLQLQHDCTSAMKVTWRTCGTACLLLPFCGMEVVRYGFHPLTFPQLLIFVVSTVSYVIMVVGFVLALEYTAVGNAVILSNSQALLLLVGKLAVGAPVTTLEGSGAITAFCGAVLCSLDSAATAAGEAASPEAFVPAITVNDDVSLPTVGLHRWLLGSQDDNAGDDDYSAGLVSANVTPSSYTTLTGDAYALLSGVGGVGYLVFAKAVRAHLKLYTFMFATMAVACALCVAAQVLLLKETVTLDFNVQHGLFGFLVPIMDRLYVEILIVAVCNMLGTLGYVRAMQYFDNLVISVAALMEPVVAELMAALMGVSTLPGAMGWLGNALVAVGTFAVVFPTPGKASSTSH